MNDDVNISFIQSDSRENSFGADSFDVWWDYFLQLVTRFPRDGENCRLSVEKIYPIDTGLYSIRDCARIAIEKLTKSHRLEMADEYGKKSKQLIKAYDTRVLKKVERTYMTKIIKYMLIVFVCMFFSILMAAIRRNSQSVIFLILIVLSLLLAIGSAGIAAFFYWQKTKIQKGQGGTPGQSLFYRQS